MSRTRMLLMHSVDPGPWVDVARVHSIEVRGAGKSDIVQIDLEFDDGPKDENAILIKGSQHKNFTFPMGKMRASLIKGKSPVTVIAHLERIGRKDAKTRTDERHPILGSGIF